MTLYAILAELGWTFAEVNKIFQGDRSVSSNLFIKKKLIEGWKLIDGMPKIETGYDKDGILVVQAWTFSLAIKGAIGAGLKWDVGNVFRWVRPHKDLAPQLESSFNLYELRTIPTLLEIEYKKAKEFSPPYPGSIYQFKANYNGSFAVYQNKVVKTTFAAYKNKFPEKVFYPFVKRGLVSSPESGANLRLVPYTKSDPIIIAHPELSAVVDNGMKNIPFNTRMDIQKKTDDKDGWYYVKTEFGEEGYVSAKLVEINLPAPDVRYYLVQKGDTALGIARKFYSAQSKDNVGKVQGLGEDFRDYVMKLAEVNKGRGMKFPTSDVSSESAWSDVQVFDGLRIWIPSAGHMYELIESTDSGNLHGQRWVKDSLQTILDASPNNLIINTFLAEWRRIPQDQRAARVHDYAVTGAEFLKKLTFSTPQWLDATLLAVNPALYGIKCVTTLLQHFIIGYLDRMASLDPMILVNNLERFLTNLTKVDYLVGLVEGTIEGIKGWFVDLWDMIVGVMDIAGEIFNIKKNVERLGKLGEMIMKAVEYIQSGKGDLLKFLSEFNPLDLLSLAEEGLKAGGLKLGVMLADRLISFTSQSPYAVGHDIGILIGYVIPEILLAVFSAAISTALKAAVKAFRTVFDGIISPLMRGAKVVLSSIQEALGVVRALLTQIKKFVAMLVKSGKERLGKMIQDLLEAIERFLKGKADEAIEESVRKGNEVVEGVSHLDDGKALNKEKYGKEAAEDAEKGGLKKDEDYDEKIKALIEAKAITEAADLIEPSIHPSILVAFLDKRISSDKVHFEYESIPSELKLKYVIWMIGSRVRVDGYDIEIPDIGSGFDEWYDSISIEDFEKLWNDKISKKIISKKIRQPGELHEWLMVARANVFKRWGVTMGQIKGLRTFTDETEFLVKGVVVKHGETGSGLAHNKILELIDKSNSFDEFVQSLNIWADTWVNGGRSKLPPGLIR